jgi:hypothetical protein
MQPRYIAKGLQQMSGRPEIPGLAENTAKSELKIRISHSGCNPT